MRLQAPHCPSCGAPVAIPTGAARASCSYCNALLVVEQERVSYRPERVAQTAEQKAASEPPPYPQPEVTLFAREAPRFELSMLEQKIPGKGEDIFKGVELPEDRFALYALRVVDEDGVPQRVDLAPATEALEQSLADDGDPGLAANLALDALCRKAFTLRLECAILLFEPRHMTVTPYLAGSEGAASWVSSEEGRSVTFDVRHGALEKKHLREARDHFAPGRRVSLVSHDLVVLASAGALGRGDRRSGSEQRAFWETLNAQLGEEPLKVVTLAKNAFWEVRQKDRHAHEEPSGDVCFAAVRAVPPPLVDALPRTAHLQVQRSRKYEVALLHGEKDLVRKVALHDEREVIVWLSPVSGELDEAKAAAAVEAIVGVLDRKDHGDNDNPRRAGREGYEALGVGPDAVRMAVIQLFDRYRRVKYFRAGWHQPVALGPRGVSGDSMQQFDEGGEATVNEGSRLLFPGGASYEGEHAQADSLATVWTGGKASRLYEAMVEHWKTKKTDRALEKLARALISDQPEAPLIGVALVTGVP